MKTSDEISQIKGHTIAAIGVIITIMIAAFGWVFAVSERTAVNEKSIESLEKATESGFEKLDSSIRSLQTFQREDMSEIRLELRALNTRIDEVIEKKPAQYAIWDSL